MDLNLRNPQPEPRIIRGSLSQADVLKINEEELGALRQLLTLPEGEEAAVRALMDTYLIGTVAVTSGAAGSRAYNAYGERAEAPGLGVMVIDTVGSGDAFTAAFATQLVSGRPLADSLALANAAGAYVAGQAGATPPISPHIIRQFAEAAHAAAPAAAR